MSTLKIPRSGAGRPAKYPFSTMNVGDTAFFEGQDSSGLAAKAARHLGHRKGWKFSARNVEGGVRIWRTE